MFLKTVIACVFLLHTSRCCHFRVGAFSPSIAHRSSRGTATRRPQPAFISVTLKESSNNEPENPKELTPDSIAEMAEVSFVNACLQLAQGCVHVLSNLCFTHADNINQLTYSRAFYTAMSMC